MSILNKKDREILKQLHDDLLTDIEMLEQHFSKIEGLLKKDKIHISELGDDIETAIQRRKNRKFALITDIVNLETEYNINIDFNEINRCIIGLSEK
ncbi:MAG TPA: hypothetical protein IAD11_05975 [Candidatus Stercorousia faecigallinarum]|nr:hypothetical protein [Candidatus Stercorousia faecigallinarum]